MSGSSWFSTLSIWGAATVDERNETQRRREKKTQYKSGRFMSSLYSGTLCPLQGISTETLLQWAKLSKYFSCSLYALYCYLHILSTLSNYIYIHTSTSTLSNNYCKSAAAVHLFSQIVYSSRGRRNRLIASFFFLDILQLTVSTSNIHITSTSTCCYLYIYLYTLFDDCLHICYSTGCR